QLTLRQGEDDRDGLQLGDDDKPVRVGRMHDVALVDESDAGPAGERRRDRRIIELSLRGLDRRLIAADLRLELSHRGALRIDLLFRGEVARCEIAEALQVE